MVIHEEPCGRKVRAANRGSKAGPTFRLIDTIAFATSVFRGLSLRAIDHQEFNLVPSLLEFKPKVM